MFRNRNNRKVFLKKWYRHYAAGKIFVYVDESGFAHSSAREYGYAAIGKKVYGVCSGHTRPRTSLIAARIGKALAATMLFAGTCNASIFNAWLENELCKILKPNMVVIMDNAAFHKSEKTKELIQNTGAELLFLPPYSPDLNPIENSFGTIKKNRSNYPNIPLEQIINMYENYSE